MRHRVSIFIFCSRCLGFIPPARCRIVTVKVFLRNKNRSMLSYHNETALTNTESDFLCDCYLYILIITYNLNSFSRFLLKAFITKFILKREHEPKGFFLSFLKLVQKTADDRMT